MKAPATRVRPIHRDDARAFVTAHHWHSDALPRRQRPRSAYAKKFDGPIRDARVTRVACAFADCPMPPAFGPKTFTYCHAHKKQLARGQTLRPFVPRSDIEARWEAWARARVAAWKPNGTGLRHPTCGERVRTLKTHPNGRHGWRYCWCPTCDVRCYVDPRRRFHAIVDSVKARRP